MFYLMVVSLVFRFFDYVRLSQVYFSVDPQKYLTSHFLWLHLVLWIFHGQVKWFWCTLMTRESQVCQHKSLAMLCHFFYTRFDIYSSCILLRHTSLCPLRLWLCCLLQMHPKLSSGIFFLSGSSHVFQWFHRWLFYWANCCPLQFFSLSGLRAGR